MRVRFLGSGDAFGSGGRFNTCFYVEAAAATFLIDCGTTALVAMRRFGVDPGGVDAVLVSHLHGDHFGGLPFFILDGQLVSKRTRPLIVAGPPGIGDRLRQAMEVLFPGSAETARKFETDVRELAPGVAADIGGAVVTPFEVNHACGAPPFALRIACDGRTICYSGDTEWTPNLAAAARGADLFIAEAYFYEKAVKYHLDLKTLEAHLKEIAAKRLILTHMSQDMLARLPSLPYETAEDGKVVEV
jgi:ribonuclease BN (tRNA processing enzyme)